MTVREAADELGVTNRRILARIKDGSLPAQKIPVPDAPVPFKWDIALSDLEKIRERKSGRPKGTWERENWSVDDRRVLTYEYKVRGAVFRTSVRVIDRLALTVFSHGKRVNGLDVCRRRRDKWLKDRKDGKP